MPALWLASLAGLLMQLAATLFGKIIISLGLSAVSYTGISFVLDQLSGLIFAQFSGIGGAVAAFVSILHLQDAFSMILSAITVKFTLAGLTNGSMSKIGFKAPGAKGGLF